jgi:hypothetical protein
VTSSCILISRHGRVFSLISIYFYSNLLTSTTKASACFFSMYASAQYTNIISINQVLMCNILFQAIPVYLNLPNGASKAKLKSNGDKPSPCFKPFLIGNMSDKFLPVRIVLYVSFRHIFISLTSFMGYQTQ